MPRLFSRCILPALLVLFFFFTGIKTGFTQSQELKDNIQKLVALYQIVDYAYVDSVEMGDLVENAIIETLKELDPHSSYIPKREIERAEEPLRGSFEGIGITFQIFKDTILVIAPIPGGPSDKLGIMAGDKIIIINDTIAHGDKVNNQYVMDRLRGKKGTSVVVSIYRKNRSDLIEYTIIRDKIPINSIDAVFMASPEIGYIKLNRFSRTSLEEFETAVADLSQKGMKNLILDLRGNSGGYLSTAVELSDQFLPGGRIIVYTEGFKAPEQKYWSTPGGEFQKGKVQDWDRGIVIGRRSFGKGLVQRPFPLPDGSVIRLTTSRYHTPTGRGIQKPYDNGLEEYYMDIYNRMKHGELVNPDSISFPDSLKYYTPANRVVYGGGGIMPDIFIPWDSTWISDYYTELRRKGVLNQFTVQYVNDNRENILAEFPGVDDYKKGFILDEAFMKDFIAFAEGMDVEFDEEGYGTSGVFLRQQIKAWMARNLWDASAASEVFSEIDDGFLKAMEVLNDESLFRDWKIHY